MITIRAATIEDAPGINRLRNQHGVRRGTLAMPFESVAGTRMFLAANTELRTSLAACRADGLILGEASLVRNKSPRRAHAATLGIMVADEAQGQGIGTSLLAALLDLADNWLNLHRLELDVFAGNAPALALYKKSGFEIEATQRRYALQDGVLADSLVMARLRPGLPRDHAAPPASPACAPRGPFILRATEPEDLPAITALMNQPGVRHGTLGTPCAPEARYLHFAEPQDGQRVFAAVAGNKLCGLTMLIPGQGRRAHSGYLALLAVDDAYAGQGIGRAMLAAALDAADHWHGFSRVGLAVLADNHHAIRLYESFGFETEGRLRADVFRQGAYADALAMARLR